MPGQRQWRRNMVILDANAILRYILKDIEEQSSQVMEAIRNGAITTPEILAEVIYVLSGLYQVSRSDVTWFIHCVILDVRVENVKAVRYALGVFNQTSLDFVDCLLIAYNKVLGINVLSFDKKLNQTMNRDLGIYQINTDNFSVENEI